MFSAVYTSTAVQPFDTPELQTLLTQSRVRNTTNEVTGMLLYKNAHFIQSLEGSEDAVHALLRAIEADTRHRSMRIVLEEQIDERRFPAWSMGFPHGGDITATPGYSDFLQQRQALGSSTAKVQLLLDWFRDH